MPVATAVHDDLRARILDGRLSPGDAVPSERTLSADFGVNRHAVREALRRLQQAGLISVTHGGATRVLDWRAHGGLELLVDLAAYEPSLLEAIVEMRASIGADAAALCARRAPRAIELDGDDLEAYERFWERIVEGSGNIAYRLAFNSLVAARHGRGIDPEVYRAEVEDQDAVRALAGAIEAGDEDGARHRARELLERAVSA
jgi:GntR family transcriptional regulator, transcriptional repressor for pyruvate dehydrogenase complex